MNSYLTNAISSFSVYTAIKQIKFVIWLLVLITTVIPASFVGVILMFFTLIGEAPVKSIITEAYNYAETSVRPAALGRVLIKECADKNTEEKTLTKPNKPKICGSYIQKEILITEAIDRSLETLKLGYVVLVILLLVILVAFKPNAFLSHKIEWTGAVAKDV